MSTFDLRIFSWRVAILLGGLAAGAAALRCAPPGQCLRMSDCESGETCSEGQCHAEQSDPDATAAEGGEGGSDAPATDAPADSVVDRAAPDAADGGADADASPADADASPEAAADF